MSAASAEYVASWGNMEQWERVVETYQKTIVPPEKLLDTLSAISGDTGYEEVLNPKKFIKLALDT